MMKSNLHRKRLSAVPALIFLSVFLMLSTSNLSAVIKDNDVVQDVRHQKKRISGIIRDVNGAPVIGAGIIESKRPSNGAVSDLDGRFTLEIEDDSNVEVSCMGYASQVVSTSGRTSLEIVMIEDEKILDEVVVIGYGSQSRATLTTAVSKLDNKALENIPYTNAASALQGGVPGLTVQSYNGQPGLAPRVVLRGGTSIKNPEDSSPLYIVDGVIRPDMNDIPASEINSIQVLKDAASTAIYGARASNGVILITTKSGGEGPARITFSYDFSFANEAKELELVSAGEYIVAARQSIMWRAQKDPTALDKLTQATGYGTGNNLTNKTAFTTMFLNDENRHKLDEGWQTVKDPYTGNDIIYKETDFQKLRKRTAFSHNYNVSISGGSSRASYSSSLGYLDGQGTALNSDYARLSYNLNGSLKVRDNLKVSGRVLYTNVNSHNVYGDPDEVWTTMLYTFVRSAAIPGTTKYTFEDGTIAPGQSNSMGNPHYYQVGPYAPRKKQISNTLTMGTSAIWYILPELSFEPSASIYQTDVRYRQFQPAYLSGITTMNTTRSAGAYHSVNRYYQLDAVLTYRKSFEKHNLEAKLGYEYYQKDYSTLNAYGEGAATDLIPTLNATATPTKNDGYERQFVTEGLFSRINYDYDQKYMVSFNIRYDGASSLGAESRTGFFPGVSAGWNLHKENFWRNMVSDGLVRLKLRASYGVNGNVSGLGEYTAQGTYAVGGEYAGAAAITPSELPNEKLCWERSKTADVGFDLGLFNQRVEVIFDAYNRVTDNLLTDVNLPGSSGYSKIKTNNGSLGNKGLEVALNAYVFKPSSPFQWKTSFNISAVRTRILKLPDNGVEKNRQGGTQIYDPVSGQIIWAGGLQEGGRVGDILGYHYEGVYSTDEEAAKAPVDKLIGLTDKRKYGGDAIFTDFDGDNDIDSYDQYVIGNRYPSVTGGFVNTFSYKNFSLNIRADFTLGHYIYNYGRRHLDGQLQGDLMPTKYYYDNSWKQQGDDALFPRYIWQNQQNSLRQSNLYVEKGDFLAIREVSLVYLFPERLIKNLRLTNLKMHATGSNLHYFTAYSGLNPEGGGDDNGRYPNPLTITFGIQASF